MIYVIAYDVRKNRGRRRVAKRLEQVGFRRQKSVFEGEASPSEIGPLLDELARVHPARPRHPHRLAHDRKRPGPHPTPRQPPRRRPTRLDGPVTPLTTGITSKH